MATINKPQSGFGRPKRLPALNRGTDLSRDDRGFTLIEVLVSISVFSIALLGLAASTVTVIQGNQKSYLTTVATNFAQDKLEELKSRTGSALPTCPSYATAGCSDSTIYSGATLNRSWQVTANSPVAGVTQIDVQVAWTDYTNRTVTISSSVAN